MSEVLLTVAEVAERLNTGERFVRRLIEEQRITVVHLGRLVRIPETAVNAFIKAGTVHAVVRTPARRRHLRVVS
jgi:excisionase family DNA binding protein